MQEEFSHTGAKQVFCIYLHCKQQSDESLRRLTLVFSKAKSACALNHSISRSLCVTTLLTLLKFHFSFNVTMNSSFRGFFLGMEVLNGIHFHTYTHTHPHAAYTCCRSRSHGHTRLLFLQFKYGRRDSFMWKKCLPKQIFEWELGRCGTITVWLKK